MPAPLPQPAPRDSVARCGRDRGPEKAMLRSRYTSVPRVAVAVLATLLSAMCRDNRGPTSPAQAITPAGTETAGTAAILVGAGEVARCDNTKDEATALLLDSIAGTVFTTGDNIRASGSLSDFSSCYAPSWGRHKARTRPAVHPGVLAASPLQLLFDDGPRGGEAVVGCAVRRPRRRGAQRALPVVRAV